MARWCYKVALPMRWEQILDYFLLIAAMDLWTEFGTTCAWSETKAVKNSLLGKRQYCCLWVLQTREHGQFPWELWESLGLIAAESSKPTFPILSLTGIWRSLALWCGMAVAFPVPGLSWVRAGREGANPQWAAPGWQHPGPTAGSAQGTEISHQWSEM